MRTNPAVLRALREAEMTAWNKAAPATTAPHVLSVGAGVPPAVEPGILPGGSSCGGRGQFHAQRCHFGRQDTALYGSQDGCRYSRKPGLNTHTAPALAAIPVREARDEILANQRAELRVSYVVAAIAAAAVVEAFWGLSALLDRWSAFADFVHRTFAAN